MFRYQIATVLKKPQVQIKLLAITLLMCLNIYDQVRIVSGFAENFGKKEDLTVAVFLCHIFNYLDLYHMVIFVGFLLLIPDIVCEEHMERQFLMLHRNRSSAAATACLRLLTFTALYVLWLVILSVLISGIMLRNFSMEWPHFIKVMMNTYSGQGSGWMMSLIMLPRGALQYSPVMAAVLVVLRTFLGFCFLAELACLVRLLTGKIQNGVLSVAVLIAFEKFMYYSLGGGILQYCKADADVSQAKMEIDLIKTTIVPFFTFRSMTDDFTEWLRYGIVAGFVLAAVTAFGIVWYYRKGDLGDADRDA